MAGYAFNGAKARRLKALLKAWKKHYAREGTRK